jgi:uncharacterized FlaG/YvyC family protein
MDIKNVIPQIGVNASSASVKITNKDPAVTGKQSKATVDSQDLLEESQSLTTPKLGEYVGAEKRDIDQAVAQVNTLFQAEQRKLSFSVNETTKDLVVEVRDAETDEVIRQIPPEFVVRLAERMHEIAADETKGVLLRDQA